MSTKPFVVLDNVAKRWNGQLGVENISLDIEEGSFVALLGPSGCGKSTSLRLLAGLELPDEGKIFIEGRDVTTSAASDRNLSMVFQSYALFPHLSVAENVIFGLKVRRVPKAERMEKMARALEITGLEGLESRKPGELSGGQRQRVALARAARAVVDRVLELAHRVHPHVHVRRALLGRLLARIDVHAREGVRPELAAREGHVRAGERRRHPLVGVVEVAVVVVEHLVVTVRAAGAYECWSSIFEGGSVVHLALRLRREALQRAGLALGHGVEAVLACNAGRVCGAHAARGVSGGGGSKVGSLERGRHRRLVFVERVVLRHVRAREVAGDRGRSVGALGRGGRLRGDDAAERAHHVARDAEASVGVLERRLDRSKVGHRARDVSAGGGIEDQAELHVVGDDGGGRGIAGVHHRQHRRGESGALRRVLGLLLRCNVADLVRVAERALHERHRHQADDLLDDRPHLGAVALLQQVAARGEQAAGLEELAVDHRDAAGRAARRAARAEVGAPLLRQAVDHRACRLGGGVMHRALERARVEGHALVPSVHRDRAICVLVALCRRLRGAAWRVGVVEALVGARLLARILFLPAHPCAKCGQGKAPFVTA